MSDSTDSPVLILTEDERKIIANAIIWVLDGPFGATFPPLLSSDERADLERLLRSLEPRHHAGGSVTIRFGGSFSRAPGRLRVPYRVAQQIQQVVGSFYGEMLHSTTEYEIVTGLRWGGVEPLMRKLKATFHSLFEVASFRSLVGPERDYRGTSRDHSAPLPHHGSQRSE